MTLSKITVPKPLIQCHFIYAGIDTVLDRYGLNFKNVIFKMHKTKLIFTLESSYIVTFVYLATYKTTK